MGGEDGKFSFRLLKEQVSIGQVLDAYGLTKSLTARGEQLYGPCPVHGGDNRTAFRVDLRRGMWRCFTACGGGDCVELIRRIEDCGYAEAARHLYRLADTGRSTPARCAMGHRSEPVFRPFLHRIRLNPQVPFLQKHKGVTVSTARSFEAGCTDRSAFLRGTVAVRLHDLRGHALGYCGRRLQRSEITRWGKWRFPGGFPKSKCLYNAHRAAPVRAGGIVVVECPWAVMRLTQAGIPGAVALLGTAISDVHTRWLAGAPRVLLLLDGDNAGRRASVAIAQRLAGSAVVHELADGQEPEDLSDQQLARLVAKRLALL